MDSPRIPPIDPAEALVVHVGLEPFLRHTSRDLESTIVRSESLASTLEAKIYRFINREEREPPADLHPFDFDAVVALLDEPETDQLEKTIAAFGQRGDLALQVGQQVTRMHAYVQQQIPRRVHSTLAGDVPIPPARSEFYRFRRVWTIARAPLSMFDDLQEYALSRDQVTTFAALFPSTFAALWPTVQECLVRKGTASKGPWQVPRQKETLLRVLCQQEAPSMVLAQALAELYSQEAAESAKAQGGSPTKPAVSAATSSTPTERLDAAG